MKRKDREREKESDQADEDSLRRPDAWERFRILVESIDQARRFSEIADHKARYALVMIGVVNAAVILLGTRSDFLSGSPAWLRPWLEIVLIPYVGATFAALWFAISCLRPRTLHMSGPQPGSEPGKTSLGAARAPQGLLFWEGIVRRSLPAYQQAWSDITLGQLNAELVIVAHNVAGVNHAKFTAARRLYIALLIVIVLATVLLTCDVFFGLFWNPISGQPA